MTSSAYLRYSVFMILASALLLAACGGSDETPVTESGFEVASGDENASTPDGEDQLFDTGFGQVCRETGQPRAADYVPGPGVHPILLMQSRDGTEYHQQTTTLPDGWGAQWPELHRTELVACARQVSATPKELCGGYEDDETGNKWSVQTYDVVYDYTVRVAQTAEVLGQSTFEAPSPSCPMLSFYREGDPHPVPYYPSVGDGQIELFVRPFVTGS